MVFLSSIRSFQFSGSTYSPADLVGSIDLSPMVTISSFNLTLSLTNGFLSDEEYLISKSSNPL